MPDGNQAEEKNAMLTTLRNFLARMIVSTGIEATYDPIAYHDAERAGELRFSQSSSLPRFY